MATVQPSNNSELQLFRVLQRANLLQYFETFITQGGDDVQQLCEAGEDEFLEIMALVGMASKPLHVRRLQKALQEWVANPAAFEVAKKYPTHVMSITCSSAQNTSPSHSMERSNSLQDYKVTPSQSSTISTSTPWKSQARDASPSDGSNLDDPSSSNSPQGDLKDIMKDVLYNTNELTFTSMVSQPALLEHQVAAIATAAAMLAPELPPFEPKSMPKKQISKDITKVMMLPADEPGRMDAMRKYAAIYGRFDSKRKNYRPMSLHEISVNEAAAQLCSHIPALLTRREELFPLARQVVRDSGYHYSKGHSRAAEVLVQPKLEQGEALPSTSSIVTTPTIQEDSFNDLQSELTQLTLELSELAKEQNRIRSALRVLLETNDHDQMKLLTAEMDDLNDRQTAMNKRRQRIVNTITKYRKGGTNTPLTAGCATKPAPKLSPSHGQQKSGSTPGKYNGGCYGYSDESLPTNPLNTLYMAAVQNHKDSLFEEGLRIATQYGMSDFAQELIGMKSTKEDVDTKVDCGVSVASGGNSSVFASYSSPSSFSTSSGEVVTSSSSHTMAGSGKFMQLLPSSSSSFSAAAGSDLAVSHMTSRSPGHSSASGHEAIMPADNKNYHTQSSKYPLSSEASSISNDDSLDGSTVTDICNTTKLNTACDKQNIPSAASESVGQDSTTTTTTITTKSGQVIEVETRRSSRRKTGEPDYYLINGGEKRFRSGNIRRSSSTSSERALPHALAMTPVISPMRNTKLASLTQDDNVTQIDLGELRRKSQTDINKLTLALNQSSDDIRSSESRSGMADDLEYENDELEVQILKRKVRSPSFLGEKLGHSPAADYSK